jgi:hypothetical protein
MTINLVESIEENNNCRKMRIMKATVRFTQTANHFSMYVIPYGKTAHPKR